MRERTDCGENHTINASKYFVKIFSNPWVKKRLSKYLKTKSQNKLNLNQQIIYTAITYKTSLVTLLLKYQLSFLHFQG